MCTQVEQEKIMRNSGRFLVTSFVASLAFAAAAQAASVGYYPTALSENTTGAPNSRFTGAPDDQFYGLGGQIVTFDFGTASIVDGAGPDFNVYEVDSGNVEFDQVQISVSNDGVTFYNVSTTFYPAVDLVGDDKHGNASFRRAYDLADITALAANSISSIQFVRFNGNGTGSAGVNTGFDLDAMGAVNFAAPPAAVPTPAAATAGMALLGALGLLRSRRGA
jgi:hypothetical protein